MAWFTFTAIVDGNVAVAADVNTPLTSAATGTVTVAHGGTGLNSGVSGGIPYFSSTTAIASSTLLTQYGVVYGGGAGAAPVATAAGTTGQFLGATTSAAPTWQTPGGYKIISFTRDMSAASGSVAYTGVGFTSRYVEFLASNGDEATRYSIGASDGTAHMCQYGDRNSGVGVVGADTSVCIRVNSSVGADFLKATVSAFGSDGFTLAYTKGGSMTGTATIIAKCFK